jgi:hypothetical protein
MVMSDYRLPNFDEDPTIDTVYSLYERSRTDLTPGLKASMDRHFDFGIKDIVQPCGYTEHIIEDFIHGYGKRQDIGVLIGLLKSHPVYGLPEISDEIIRLLEKTRIKPVSKKTYETERLHENVKNEFRRINPKRGYVDAAYHEIAITLKTTPVNVETIIKRARKAGQLGIFAPLNIEKKGKV